MREQRLRHGIAVLALAVAAYEGVGTLIAIRLPRNPIGWLLGFLGLVLSANVFFEQYGLRGLATAGAVGNVEGKAPRTGGAGDERASARRRRVERDERALPVHLHHGMP